MSKRILQGVVVKKSGKKTVSVEVLRKVKHPLYSKFIVKKRKYLVDTGEKIYQEKDQVKIIESKPISKLKRWMILEEIKE